MITLITMSNDNKEDEWHHDNSNACINGGADIVSNLSCHR